ncbi:hypothetical protein F5146DRAFT_697035 [Armillaria mellea]|nr:hypothetical protein F5146DRAFT_697035 [Armillaria mellea]
MTEPIADPTQVISERIPLLQNRIVSHTVHAGSIVRLFPVIVLFSIQWGIHEFYIPFYIKNIWYIPRVGGVGTGDLMTIFRVLFTLVSIGWWGRLGDIWGRKPILLLVCSFLLVLNTFLICIDRSKWDKCSDPFGAICIARLVRGTCTALWNPTCVNAALYTPTSIINT